MKFTWQVVSVGGGALAALIFQRPANEFLGQPAGSWLVPFGIFIVVAVVLNAVTKPLAAASATGWGTTPLGRRLSGFVARPITFVLTVVLLWLPLGLVPGPVRYELLQQLPKFTAEVLVMAYLVGMIWLATRLVVPVRQWVAVVTTPLRRLFRIVQFGKGGAAQFAGIMEEWAARYKKGAVLLGSSLFDPGWRVGLKDDRHMLTIGGTRAGKNRSLLIPNLLTWPGSALVIDPKGTNAAVTAARRGHGGGRVTSGLGQDVYVLDPFAQVAGVKSAHFNPLEFIDPDSSKVAEDIWLVADALVVPSGDDFFDVSALGLISGIIAHVITRERDQGGANLSRVRELLARGDDRQWDALLDDMLGNDEAGGIAASAAGQMKTAGPKAGGDIKATALYHTRWLDSTAMGEILQHSDFAMRDIKAKPMTVYLVLPPEQLQNHARFLRLFVNLAIQTASTGANPPYPVLFMLDEFFSLGKLDLAERAVALLGSRGLKFWPVVQNLTQLAELYGKNWETFWDAAAAVQIFGIGDDFTEDYAVRRLGRHKVQITGKGPGGQTQVTEQIHNLREREELEFEVAREATTELVWRKGADPMFLKRINYDQAFSENLYNPDPDHVKGQTVSVPAQTIPDLPPVKPGEFSVKPADMTRVFDMKPADKPQAKPKPAAPKTASRPKPESPKPQTKKAPAQASKPPPAPKKPVRPPPPDPFDELDALIGLDAVKEQVRKVANLVKIQKAREEAGLPVPDVSYHLVFTGNPGTGKTTVARIIGRIYQQLGVLKKGHLVETDRSGLVGQHVGSTAPKVLEVVSKAFDGILFIDEAYTLKPSHPSDYGSEAIAILLKQMDDNRDRLAVIVAGYTEEMEGFISHNPGLRSRFKTFIEFPDYGPDELMDIFRSICTENSYTLTPDAQSKSEALLKSLHENRDRDFGNGRTVRNLFEECLSRHASRLSELEEYSATDLMILHEEDVPPVITSDQPPADREQ